MKEKFGPVPLKNDEKARISAEYATILVHVTTLKGNANIKRCEEFWYQLLSTKEYYENCLNINEFALRFLTRTFNECTVESQGSAIDSIDSSLNLKHITADKLSFTSSNGPHPLHALNVIEEALDL